MDLFTYLYPTENVAQLVVATQVICFCLWVLALGFFMLRDLRLRGQVEGFDVSIRDDSGSADSKDAPQFLSNVGGKDGARPSKVPSNRVIVQHLAALRDSGQSSRQLDVSGLIRNSSNRLTSNRGWMRSVLSLFIVLGLLGTLWGLASSLSHLSTLSPGQSQITNENLAQGLNVLLSKLGGAFAPSIWGVFFTIVGVILFSIYLRAASIPLINSLERRTLIRWAPLLAAKKIDESKLMQENIKAAQEIGVAASTISYNVSQLVTTFNENLPALVSNLTQSVSEISEKLSNDATELADDVKRASKTLKALTVASENLNEFSQTFKDSVEKLYPFSDAAELRGLYEELLGRSKILLDSNEEFQQRVHDQLAENVQQKVLLIDAVNLFKDRVTEASSSIKDEMGGTAEAAKDAFGRLSTQNEDVIKELVNQIGTPVAEALTPIPAALGGIEKEIKRINAPLEGVKDSMEKSSYQIVKHADDSLTQMGDKLQAQVENLEVLSGSIDNLAPKIEELTNKIDGFSSKTDKTGERIDRFSVQSEKFGGTVVEFGRKADEVIRAVSTGNGRRATGNRSPGEVTIAETSKNGPRKLGLWQWFKGKLPGGKSNNG
ncbi:MAG: MotA/TolQ/ExbB proton channel family protein [Chloracidobacterium sp.]|nr:MotA/TolQ/ExbB proton channel family protein [Chloracidobacterium sp.]